MLPPKPSRPLEPERILKPTSQTFNKAELRTLNEAIQRVVNASPYLMELHVSEAIVDLQLVWAQIYKEEDKHASNTNTD